MVLSVQSFREFVPQLSAIALLPAQCAQCQHLTTTKERTEKTLESKLITVSGVSGYIDEKGTAHLNLENVARGLGFTRIATSGNEVVRWERVDSYLSEMGYVPICGHDAFIPENIFYRLAFKASNKTALAFQAKVADEILPAIRKTGTYSVRPMTQAELTAAIAQNQVEIERKATEALEVATKTQKMIEGALDALAKESPTDWQTATNEKIRGMALKHGLAYPVLFGDMYKELEDTAHVRLTARVSRLRNRMKQSGATSKDRLSVSKLHVISLDPALKTAFDGIVRRYNAKYATEAK